MQSERYQPNATPFDPIGQMFDLIRFEVGRDMNKRSVLNSPFEPAMRKCFLEEATALIETRFVKAAGGTKDIRDGVASRQSGNKGLEVSEYLVQMNDVRDAPRIANLFPEPSNTARSIGKRFGRSVSFVGGDDNQVCPAKDGICLDCVDVIRQWHVVGLGVTACRCQDRDLVPSPDLSGHDTPQCAGRTAAFRVKRAYYVQDFHAFSSAFSSSAVSNVNARVDVLRSLG